MSADPLGDTTLFDNYEATAAAKQANPTRETIDAFGAAMQALHESRKYWRQIGEGVRYRDQLAWEAEQDPELLAGAKAAALTVEESA